MPVHQDAPLDVVIRNTCANVAILLTKVHNLQADTHSLQEQVSELRTDSQKLRSVVLTLLADPSIREDALRVIKEWGVKEGSQVKQRTT